MIIVCIEGSHSDTSITLVEHPDAAEALACLAMLPNGPEPVCSAEAWTLHDETCEAKPLIELVACHLLETYGADAKVRQKLFDCLPISVLRAAVEWMAACHDFARLLASHHGMQCSEAHIANARTLREALFLREQRDRIAADLADMERIAAMTVDEGDATEVKQ